MTRGVVVAAHQPDLLPYSGFWHKMARADLFDLRIYDQFLKKSGYHRRVTMRGQWATVPVLNAPVRTSICDIRIDPAAPMDFAKLVRGRYQGSAFWNERGKPLHDFILEQRTEYLWQFNFELMRYVRDLLGITTPLCVGPPVPGYKNDKLVNVLQHYQATTYLSGAGARSYMGDCAEFTAAGIDVEFSTHEAPTGDSILTILMDYDNPLAEVLR